jgi:DNA-binding NarL/FixJ family response regulator
MLKILAAEDCEGNSKLLTKYLEETLGCFEINIAINENNLYFEMSKQKYDVIILDLWIYGGLFTSNAITIIKNLRGQYAYDGKIIVQTGDLEYEKECMNAGADCYVLRDQDSLINAINGQPYKQDDYMDPDSILRNYMEKSIERKMLRLK